MDTGFTFKILQQASSIITQLCIDRFNTWKESARNNNNILELDVFPEMLNLTADAIGLYTFSRPFQGELSKSFSVVLSMLGWKIWEQSVIPFWKYVPSPANVRYWYHLWYLRNSIAKIIKKRMNMPLNEREKYNDVLSMMFDKMNPQELSMSESQLRDECVGLAFAGHDTTASTISWILYLLGKHPKVQSQLHEEIINVLGDNQDIPSLQDLEKLKYCTSIIKETLRLYPPAAIGRTAIIPTTIGEYSIPAGSEIFLNIHAMHRNPEVWGETSDKFIADRFMNNLPEEQANNYLPFGGAPRTCIGMRLAMIEMKIILWRILICSSISIPLGKEEPQLLPEITLHPTRVFCEFNFSHNANNRK